MSDGNFTNALNTAAIPIDIRKFKQVLGAAQYVAVEVLVSYCIRMFFKEKRTVQELITIHSLSLPFIGGLSATLDESSPLGLESPDWADHFTEGAKGIPAVFAAEFIVQTAMIGLHMPKPTIRDILITAFAKVLSRPVYSFLYPMLGDAFRNNTDVLEEIFRRQRIHSKLAEDSKAEDA